MKLGRYLRIHNLSQTRFAADLGVTVNYWINERASPYPRYIITIERATKGEVTADDFQAPMP